MPTLTTAQKIDAGTDGLGWKVAIFLAGALSAILLFYLRDMPNAREWERVSDHADGAEVTLENVRGQLTRQADNIAALNRRLDELIRYLPPPGGIVPK